MREGSEQVLFKMKESSIDYLILQTQGEVVNEMQDFCHRQGQIGGGYFTVISGNELQHVASQEMAFHSA